MPTSQDRGAGRAALAACTAALLSACGGSKFVVVGKPLSEPAGALVTTSNRPEVGDALASELRARGYSILDTAQTSRLLEEITGSARAPGRLDTLQQGDVLAKLKGRGVGAVLAVDVRMVTSYLGGPFLDVIAPFVYGTASPGRPLTGLEWHNAWGGEPGSPADHNMRKPPKAAVKEVAAVLASLLGPPGPAASIEMPSAAAPAPARPSTAEIKASEIAAPEPPKEAAQVALAPPLHSLTPARPATQAEAAAELLP